MSRDKMGDVSGQDGRRLGTRWATSRDKMGDVSGQVRLDSQAMRILIKGPGINKICIAGICIHPSNAWLDGRVRVLILLQSKDSGLDFILDIIQLDPRVEQNVWSLELTLVTGIHQYDYRP